MFVLVLVFVCCLCFIDWVFVICLFCSCCGQLVWCFEFTFVCWLLWCLLFGCLIGVLAELNVVVIVAYCLRLIAC